MDLNLVLTLVADHPNQKVGKWVPATNGSTGEAVIPTSGDLIFFELLEKNEPFFSLKLCYHADGTLYEAVLNGQKMSGVSDDE